jgi:hypothetical protein
VHFHITYLHYKLGRWIITIQIRSYFPYVTQKKKEECNILHDEEIMSSSECVTSLIHL